MIKLGERERKRKQRQLLGLFFLSSFKQSVINWMSVDDFCDMNDLCVSMHVDVDPL